MFKQDVKEEYQKLIFKSEPQDVKEEYDPDPVNRSEHKVPDDKSFFNNNVTKIFKPETQDVKEEYDPEHKDPDNRSYSNNNATKTSGWEKPDLTKSSEVGAKRKSRGEGESLNISFFKTSKLSDDSDDWVQCPKCFVKLKNRNLLKHLRKHGGGVESKSNATKASVHEKPEGKSWRERSWRL